MTKRAAYADRFCQALQERLGGSVSVSDLGGGLIIATHGEPGGAAMSGYLPNADRRKSVSDIDVNRWVEGAASSLRRMIPAFTEKAAAESVAMLKEIGEWK